MSIHRLSLYDLHEKFTAGEVTATEIVRAYGLRIGQVEPKVKAYITQTKDAAVVQAGMLDSSLKEWRKTSPMMGMPLAIKDNICTEGVLTTCASRMLGNFVPPYDATVIGKLRAQGYLERQTSMNLRWVPQPRIQPLVPAAIPGIWSVCRVDPAEDPQRPSQPTNVLRRWDPIPADRSVSLRRFVEWWVSSRPMGGSLGTG